MEMLTVPEVATRMGIGVVGVRTLLKEGRLLGIRQDNVLVLPAEQLDGSQPVKHLYGVLTLLTDAGYSDDEALAWLTTQDDSLPGTPLQALQQDRSREVKRRAQALAF